MSGEAGERGDGDALLALAREGDEDAFRTLVEAHRAELHAHCYRMLASYHDAEDALQETLLRAWRALPGFEGRSTLRAWLYKIATNASLDVAKHRHRRELPVSYGPPVPAGSGPGAALAETTWIEPYPDRQLGAGGSPASPEARYDQRESVELAFVAALQALPASQRAVLLLREVLGFSAMEIAGLLGTSVPAVTSALQRARQGVRRLNGEPTQQQALRALGDNRARRLVEALVDALERADVGSLVGLLTEDATWAMPPLPSWYRGPAAIGEFLASFGFNERWRHQAATANGQAAMANGQAATANGQPALGCYTVDPGTGAWVASALLVLSLRGERIAGASYFLTAELLRRWGDDSGTDGAEMFARFGLPATIPHENAGPDRLVRDTPHSHMGDRQRTARWTGHREENPVYFPPPMLMPLFEDLDRRARCVAPRSLQPAHAQDRQSQLRGTRARRALRANSAASARTADAGARS